MSNCNKDLYDYDLVRKCYKCGILLLKFSFYKGNTRKDGVQRLCIMCTKQYHNDRKEQRNVCEKFNLICNKKTRTSKAFKSQNTRKTIKTND